MASLFGSSTKTSTSTNQMYPALQQGWDKALSSAADIYDSSKAPKLAPLNAWTTEAFNQTANLARSGVPNLDQIYGVQSSMLSNGGMTDGMQNAYGLLGGYAANNGMSPDLYRAANYLNNFAVGAYQEDPRLQRQLDINADRAANATATRVGGGRYGSAAIGNAMGSAVADANNSLMLQSNENSRNRQLQASQALDSLFQNAANRGLSAAGAMGSLAQAGAGNMNTAMSMAPALNELRYDGTSRLAGMGDFLQNRTQGRIDQLANFPKENTNWYTGILGGMGSNGSTTISKTPGPSAASSILGGALGGATIGSNIPGLGAGWGGLLGLGIGAFA